MRPHCAWTLRSSPDLAELTLSSDDILARALGSTTIHVLPEYRERLLSFGRRVERWTRTFLVLLGAGCVGLIGFSIAGWMVAAGASLVAVGLVIQVLPFCTPETVQMFGVRTSLVIARVAGLVLAAVGLVLALYGPA